MKGGVPAGAARARNRRSRRPVRLICPCSPGCNRPVQVLEASTVKSYRKELWFQLPARRGFVNITPEVAACLKESGIVEGLCLVNAMHITASVFINDDEP
ncbi:MAG TPA: YjbQ family protein, partial [Syntrophales bacterium]|nr:YjbQ family protein [Syntrophales bacterium]